jgi:hypothetical protein
VRGTHIGALPIVSERMKAVQPAREARGEAVSTRTDDPFLTTAVRLHAVGLGFKRKSLQAPAKATRRRRQWSVAEVRLALSRTGSLSTVARSTKAAGYGERNGR